MSDEARLAEREFAFTDADFARVRTLIHRLAGIALNDSKRNMVYSRLTRRLRERRLASFGAYLDLVESPAGAEREAFVNALTTNLTSFFREPHHFPVLAEVVRRAVARRGQARIWCAACSTGEEAWTIAMTALDALGAGAGTVRVVASDIDTAVLDRARGGVYPAEAAELIPERLVKRFFLAGRGANEGSVRVRPELAAAVDFRRINLLEASWPVQGPFDAIFCRNVMIYFDKPTQARLVGRFAPLIEPEGRLFIGHSENLGFSRELFSPCGRTVYARVPGERAATGLRVA
jgi:chemotaxis protein methyltransferase CheR